MCVEIDLSKAILSHIQLKHKNSSRANFWITKIWHLDAHHVTNHDTCRIHALGKRRTQERKKVKSTKQKDDDLMISTSGRKKKKK